VGTVLLNLFSPNGESDSAKLDDVVTDTRKLARQRRGTAVLEQASPNVKRRLEVWDGGGEATAIMQRLKAQYDPGNVLNPGRYLNGI
jgi:glycolate oxidase FAD binding subunit